MNKIKIEKKLQEELNKFRDEFLQKYVNEKELKFGHKINYKGLEWFITKVNSNSVTLMLADKMPNELIEAVFDDENIRNMDNDICFDKQSYDWKESYIRRQLNIRFLKELGIDKNDLLEMSVNYAENEYTTDLVRIPTLKECRNLPTEIIKRDSIWSFYLIDKGVCRADINQYNFGSGTGVFSFSTTFGHASGDASFRVVRPVICVKREVLE